MRAGAARLFGRRRFRAARRGGPPGARRRAVPRRHRPERLVSRGAVAEPRSSWPAGSTCRCSRWTPASWTIRATSAIPPTAATSARPSCGPDSARWPRHAASTRSSTAPTPTISASTGPGLRAAEEHRVRSPLAELGWTKAAVREPSRAARAADLGCARGAVPVEPGGLRPRHHPASGSARSRTARPSCASSASPAISGCGTTATEARIEVRARAR